MSERLTQTGRERGGLWGGGWGVLIGIGFNKYLPINVIEVLNPVAGAFLSSIPV